MTAHAILSASGSAKWLVCPRSARLEEQFPDKQTSYTMEGTFAHEVFEYVLGVELGKHPADDERAAEFFANEHWSEALHDYVRLAVDHVKRLVTPSAVVLIEQRLDFSPWVPEGFGTGDVVIVDDDVIHVCDLKYGAGIPVSAVGNSQMRLYALGAYNAFEYLFDIKTVRTTILQPRLDNWSSEELPLETLLAWADETVKPAAKLAWENGGEFVPGSHCSEGFCKARFQCAARAEESMAVARQSFALVQPELLTTEQVCAVLAKADVAIKWLNDVKDFALKEAERGQSITGWKLVEGRSNRKYVDQDAVARKLVESGIPEAVIYERSLLGITALEKAVGKSKVAELIGDLIDKPQGKPVLVPETDKRQAINPVSHFTAIAE